MKQIVTTVLLLFYFCNGFTQNSEYTFSGNIKGLDSKELRVSVKDEKTVSGNRVENVPVQNESFTLTSNIEEYTLMSVSPGVDRVVKKVQNGYYPAKSSLLIFFAFPGAKVNFGGVITDFVDAYPSGDPANNDLARLNKKIFPLLNKSVNISVKIGNKLVTDTLLIKRMKDTADVLENEVIKIKLQFLKDNPSSIASAWLLSDMMLRTQISSEDAIKIFDKLDPKLKNISFYIETAKRVNGILLTKIGNTVPDISTFRTPDSSKFELSKLRGKYLIIDFWGTWCGPCMSGMPKMKTYLEKYGDKLNILGVAQESDKGQKWKKTIIDSKLTWYHVLSGKGNEDLVVRFSVAGFPTKLIIDPKGKILTRFVGEDEGFYTELDKLLK